MLRSFYLFAQTPNEKAVRTEFVFCLDIKGEMCINVSGGLGIRNAEHVGVKRGHVCSRWKLAKVVRVVILVIGFTALATVRDLFLPFYVFFAHPRKFLRKTGRVHPKIFTCFHSTRLPVAPVSSPTVLEKLPASPL